MAVNKIKIKTGVDMPPRPKRRSKYEAAHLALAEGPRREAFEIPLPKDWNTGQCEAEPQRNTLSR